MGENKNEKTQGAGGPKALRTARVAVKKVASSLFSQIYTCSTFMSTIPFYMMVEFIHYGLPGGARGEPCSSYAHAGRSVEQHVYGHRQFARQRPQSSAVRHAYAGLMRRRSNSALPSLAATALYSLCPGPCHFVRSFSELVVTHFPTRTSCPVPLLSAGIALIAVSSSSLSQFGWYGQLEPMPAKFAHLAA